MKGCRGHHPDTLATTKPQLPNSQSSERARSRRCWDAGEDALVAEEDALNSAVLNGVSVLTRRNMIN